MGPAACKGCPLLKGMETSSHLDDPDLVVKPIQRVVEALDSPLKLLGVLSQWKQLHFALS